VPDHPDDSQRRTFVLGTGCMKGGTTWLHDYLASSPQCATGYRKEYHVFDSVDLPDLAWMRHRILGRARQSLDDLEAGRPADATFLHQASLIADPSTYADYFTGLLRSRPGTTMTLDMTPNYGLLGAERLRGVRESFADLGVRCVSVFLMRDPVERIWSQVRMQQRRRPQQNPGSAEDLVLARYAEPEYDVRTRYERTLAALDAAFPASEVHVGFYETLFEPGSLAAVCALAGIEPPPADTETRRNASPKSAPLPESTVRDVAGHFRTTYEAVAARFPQVDLAALWPSSRLA
jgi:hypothetical protein